MEIVLETRRLVLRLFNNDLEDARLLLHLNSKPGVLQYIHEAPLNSLQQSTDVLSNIIIPQYKLKLGRWALHLKTDQSFVGWCGLKKRTDLDEIDLGYRLLPSAWGNGYATEAAGACLDYGLSTLNIGEITGRAHIENTASITVLQKIGMTYQRESIVEGCKVKVFKAYPSNEKTKEMLKP